LITPRAFCISVLLALAFFFSCPGRASEKGPGPDSTFPGNGGQRADPLTLTVEEAVLMALENHRGLRVERITPDILRTYEDQQRAVFDPVVDGRAAWSGEKSPAEPSSPLQDDRTDRTETELGFSRYFPTGTEVRAGVTGSRRSSGRLETRYATRAGLSLTQALLRGRGTEVNLASLRQAGLNTRASLYELRGVSEALAAGTEEAYWDCVLAQRQLRIFEESVEVARRHLDETREIVRVGRLAETELVAARAELALRRQELIDARNEMSLARLRFLRLVNPPETGLEPRELVLRDEPAVPRIQLDDVLLHVELALRMRPDLNQARLAVQLEELEVVKTRNGLLPRMDLFISLGKTGYAESFGGSLSEISGDHYDAGMGFTFRLPVRNRDPKARHERAVLTGLQVREALENLAQLAALDVRTAYIKLDTALKQIHATRATRRLEEEKLRIETEKFRVGRSTSFMVAQAQRDLLRGRIQEIQAVVKVLKSLVDLYRLEGSLLERWGIRAPGGDVGQGGP
jgi:outer membrane protein